MGRPLFSSLYRNDMPVTSIPPQQPPAVQEQYTRWSPQNRFNPDSDEFFTGPDAVYEAFVEEEDEEQVVQPAAAAAVDDADEASSDVSAADVDQPSPMAVGSDDPTTMLSAFAYISQWEQNYRPTDASVATRHHRESSAPEVVLRTTQVDPIPIPIPPPHHHTLRSATPPPPTSQLLFAPSPAPNVTSHIYGWTTPAHHTLFPLPPSRGGPLSNPNARVSLSHINHAMPVHNMA